MQIDEGDVQNNKKIIDDYIGHYHTGGVPEETSSMNHRNYTILLS